MIDGIQTHKEALLTANNVSHCVISESLSHTLLYTHTRIYTDKYSSVSFCTVVDLSLSKTHSLVSTHTHTHIIGLETIFSTPVGYPNIALLWQRDSVLLRQRVCHVEGSARVCKCVRSSV